MTPYSELEKQFVEPGKFLMIPGFEQTGGCPNGQQVHVNFINVREVFPYISAETPKEILEQTFVKGREMYDGQDYLFTANHPLWRYYDYSPNDLIALPQIRLFELNNNGYRRKVRRASGGLETGAILGRGQRLPGRARPAAAARHGIGRPPRVRTAAQGLERRPGGQSLHERPAAKRFTPATSMPPTGWISRTFSSTARRFR